MEEEEDDKGEGHEEVGCFEKFVVPIPVKILLARAYWEM